MTKTSAELYHELAEAFDMSCNPDTASAFRELAVMAEGFAAAVSDHAPEIADPGAVHYLMLPWHAFDLALKREERALETLDGDMAQRQQAHLSEIRARRDACPAPAPGWWEDADEPNWDA